MRRLEFAKIDMVDLVAAEREFAAQLHLEGMTGVVADRDAQAMRVKSGRGQDIRCGSGGAQAHASAPSGIEVGAACADPAPSTTANSNATAGICRLKSKSEWTAITAAAPIAASG